MNDWIVSPLSSPHVFKKRLEILHAIECPIGKLNVAELCKRMGISRQTFYYYFESKYDIANWYVSVCNSFSIYRIGTTLGYRDAVLKLLLLLDEERNFFEVSQQDFRDMDYTERGRSILRDLMAETLESRSVEVDESLQVEIALYAYIMVEMTRRWICGEVDMSAEAYADLLEDCIPRRLFSLTNEPMCSEDNDIKNFLALEG